MSGSGIYRIVGVMSGTSLDGLDMALCEFDNPGHPFRYKILKTQTIPFSAGQKDKLTKATKLNGEDYFRLNSLFGSFIAKEINQFVKELDFKPQAIASHGHTIFHQPVNGFSVQLGCGATIAAETGITTVCDFRSLDVALNGQGAPLVPIGDKLLFSDYQSCLNIGGIANISFDNENDERIAFDICPANMALNYFAKKSGQEYDQDGLLARDGACHQELFDYLNNLNFYKKEGAKSLGREWFEQQFLPIVEYYGLSVQDTLNTLVHHCAFQVNETLRKNKIEQVLITGGGAFNKFLIETLEKYFSGSIKIPDEQTINFKEALIFAFLGYLRMHETINTLKTVTGASKDSVGGAVYLANQ